MEKRWIKILSAVCLTASLAIFCRAEASADTLTMTLERSTLGGDLVIEPTVVGFTPGENYAQVFTRELSKRGYTYESTGSVASDFYLAGINGIGCGYHPPACVRSLLNSLKMPVNEQSMSGGLFQFDHTSSSGWMYYVNNGYVLGMSAERPQQGDVVRFMFTLCGGTDLTGEHWDGDHKNLIKRYYLVGDKTELVRLMGQVNQDPSRLQSDPALRTAYAQALTTLKKMDATQSAVDTARDTLRQAAEAAPTPTPVITETPTPTPVITETPTPTPDITETPTPTPVITETPTPTPIITETPEPTPDITESPTPTPDITETPEPTPDITESPTPEPVITDTPAPARADISKVTPAGYDRLKITWKRVENAAGYQVSRATSAKGDYKTVATLSGGTVSYTDSGLTVGRTYFYRVRALAGTEAQRIYGAWSAVKSAKPELAAPSTLRATAGKKRVSLRWSRVKGASGYEVFRSVKRSSGYKKVAAKSAGIISCTDKKLAAKKTYYYRVRAYRTVGKKKVYGGFSPVSRVKTR